VGIVTTEKKMTDIKTTFYDNSRNSCMLIG